MDDDDDLGDDRVYHDFGNRASVRRVLVNNRKQSIIEIMYRFDVVKKMYV